MDERIAERMSDPKVAHDTRLLGDFADIYCGGLHADRPREPLASDGVTLGVYSKRTPLVCGECAALLRYAETRRALCPKDPKPFCAACETHCYRPEMRTYMQDVMRYSGPKSWKRGYAIDGVKHVLEMRRYRKSQERQRQSGADN
jgi:hypothetical protein